MLLQEMEGSDHPADPPVGWRGLVGVGSLGDRSKNMMRSGTFIFSSEKRQGVQQMHLSPSGHHITIVLGATGYRAQLLYVGRFEDLWDREQLGTWRRWERQPEREKVNKVDWEMSDRRPSGHRTTQRMATSAFHSHWLPMPYSHFSWGPPTLLSLSMKYPVLLASVPFSFVTR